MAKIFGQVAFFSRYAILLCMQLDPTAVLGARRKAKMTQTELARAAGCSRETIGNIEKDGKCFASTAQDIARALNAPVATLVLGAGRELLTRDETELLAVYRALPPMARERVRGFLLGLMASGGSPESAALASDLAAALRRKDENAER